MIFKFHQPQAIRAKGPNGFGQADISKRSWLLDIIVAMLHQSIRRRTAASRTTGKVSVGRIYAIWGIFLVGVIATYWWVSQENQRLITRYEQSSVCSPLTSKQNQSNCHETISVTVNRKWLSTLFTNVRKSNTTIKNVFAINLEVTLPNGASSTIHCSTELTVHENSSSAFTVLSYLENAVREGQKLDVVSWRGKLISVRLGKHELQTTDHPKFIVRESYPRLFGIGGGILIALIIWTGYELLRKR